MLADGRAVVPETHPYPLADRKAMVPGADGDLIQQLGRFLRDGGRPVPSVPVRIRATDFRDNYNGYAILGRDADTVIVEDMLITRTFKVFGHNGEYFAVLVSRAVRNDPDREPRAVFGFAQLELSVGGATPE